MTQPKPQRLEPKSIAIGARTAYLKALRLKELDVEYIRQLARLSHTFDNFKQRHIKANIHFKSDFREDTQPQNQILELHCRAPFGRQ